MSPEMNNRFIPCKHRKGSEVPEYDINTAGEIQILNGEPTNTIKVLPTNLSLPPERSRTFSKRSITISTISKSSGGSLSHGNSPSKLSMSRHKSVDSSRSKNAEAPDINAY